MRVFELAGAPGARSFGPLIAGPYTQGPDTANIRNYRFPTPDAPLLEPGVDYLLTVTIDGFGASPAFPVWSMSQAQGALDAVGPAQYTLAMGSIATVSPTPGQSIVYNVDGSFCLGMITEQP